MGPFCVGARCPETQPRTSLDFRPRARSAAGGEVWEGLRQEVCDPISCPKSPKIKILLL